MKGCMEEDTDLDAKMLPFARCTMHLETAMCVCVWGGTGVHACVHTCASMPVCVGRELIHSM